MIWRRTNWGWAANQQIEGNSKRLVFLKKRNNIQTGSAEGKSITLAETGPEETNILIRDEARLNSGLGGLAGAPKN